MAVSDEIDYDDPQLILDYMAIDLRIEEYLRHLDDDVLEEYDGISDEDRTMLIYLMRLAYVKGHKDGREGVMPAQGL